MAAIRIVAAEQAGYGRIHIAVIRAFVRQQLFLQKGVERRQRRQGFMGMHRSEAADGRVEMIEHRRQLLVFGAQPLHVRGRQAMARDLQRTDAQNAQRIQDHHHIDGFLYQCAIERRQKAEGGGQHGQQ